MKYAFIDEHVEQHPVRRLCSVMQVHPRGYYALEQAPLCDRVKEYVRVSALISRAGKAAAGCMAIARWTTTCETWASVAASIGWRA